jgi:formylglycine-generating enzyme required for sulfatase activity
MLMRLSIVNILLFVIAAQSSWAGNNAASPVQVSTETISILGRTFDVTPFKLEDTSRTWTDVKPYLPGSIRQKPSEPLSKDQILNKVDQLLHDRIRRYDADLKTLTDRHLKEFQKTTPKANWDWFNLALASDCIDNRPGPYLPVATVRLCQEYTSLLYLNEMLSKASEPVSPSLTIPVSQAAGPTAAQQPAAALRPLSIFKDCDHCPEMVVIPPGTFLMGASAEDRRIGDRYSVATELPQHRVTIGYSFAIGRYDVTVDQFAAFVAETGTKTGGECQLRIPDKGPHKGQFVGTPKPGKRDSPGIVNVIDADFHTPGEHVSGNYPVTCISRREALKYLQWLSKKTNRHYRFPTEAEWEYATRAGSTTPYYFSGPIRNLCKYANFGDRKSPYWAGEMGAPCAEQPSPTGLAPVGSYKPNAWGLYDTVGNTFEFIEDCRFPNYQGAPTDGSPWRERDPNVCSTGFVWRGYFFDSIYTDLRSAARCTGGGTWDERENFVSLRVAVSLDDRAWDRVASTDTPQTKVSATNNQSAGGLEGRVESVKPLTNLTGIWAHSAADCKVKLSGRLDRPDVDRVTSSSYELVGICGDGVDMLYQPVNCGASDIISQGSQIQFAAACRIKDYVADRRNRVLIKVQDPDTILFADPKFMIFGKYVRCTHAYACAKAWNK